MIVSDLFRVEMWVIHLLRYLEKVNIFKNKNIYIYIYQKKLILRLKNMAIDTKLTRASENGITNKQRKTENRQAFLKYN